LMLEWKHLYVSVTLTSYCPEAVGVKPHRGRVRINKPTLQEVPQIRAGQSQRGDECQSTL